MAHWNNRSHLFDSCTPEYAVQLALELGCQGIRTGGLTNWHKVPDEWTCPCCSRGKSDMVRLDRNGFMIGPIVLHHDHIVDCDPLWKRPNIDNQGDKSFWRSYAQKMREYQSRLDGLQRFPDTYVCGDCNNADTAGKTNVGAPKYFSFTPFEIRLFVVPRHRQANEIKVDAVRSVFEAAIFQVELLRERRIRIVDAFNFSMLPDAEKTEPAGDPVHVAQAAWNVMKQVNKSRKGEA
jgi:rubredoxin